MILSYYYFKKGKYNIYYNSVKQLLMYINLYTLFFIMNIKNISKQLAF